MAEGEKPMKDAREPPERPSTRPALDALKAEIVEPTEEPLPPLWGEQMKKRVSLLIRQLDDGEYLVRERAEEEIVRLLDGANLYVYPRKPIALPEGTMDMLNYDPRVHSFEQQFRLRSVRARVRARAETPVTRLLPGERESALKVIDEINEKAGYTFVYVADDVRPLLTTSKMTVRDPFVLEKGLLIAKASSNSVAGILLELCEKYNLAFQPAGRSVLLFRQKEKDPRRMFSSDCGRLLGCTVIRFGEEGLQDYEIYAFDPNTQLPAHIVSQGRLSSDDPTDPKRLLIVANAPIEKWKEITVPFPTKEPVISGIYAIQIKENHFTTRKGVKGLGVVFEMKKKDFNDLTELDVKLSKIQFERAGKPITYLGRGFQTNQFNTVKAERVFEMDDVMPDTARILLPEKRVIKTFRYEVTVPPAKTTPPKKE